MYKYGGWKVKRIKLNPDELKKEDPGSVLTLERRKFLEMGFVTAAVFAGDAFLSAISFIDKLFTSTEEPKESL
jgi:hypothetical protein